MSRRKSTSSKFTGSYGQFGKLLKAKQAEKMKQASKDFLSTNLKILTDEEAQQSIKMNLTSKEIYEDQKRMNDNTRTATVYTSDLS